MKRHILAGLILLLSTATAGYGRAETPTAIAADPRQLVKASDDLMRGDSQDGRYTMTVITPSWKRTLVLHVRTKARDKVLIRILSPAKEKGTTTLRVGSEMWNYLPSVERTIKIPPSMMLESWMGSDFTNDDLVKENSIVDDYTHRLLREETIEGHEAYVIELLPKPKAGVIWDKRIMWIDKTDGYPLREEFYGKNNKLIKHLVYSDVKTVSDRRIPTRWEMVSAIKKNRRTVIVVDDKLIYNAPIEDSMFTLKSLKATLKTTARQ